MSETYELGPEDLEALNDTAEWFLRTRQPRTAAEVREVLFKLYLKGIGRGIRLTKGIIEEAETELKQS